MSAAWIGEWKLLSRRIEGLSRAASVLMQSLVVSRDDHTAVVKEIVGPAAKDVFDDLRAFQARFSDSLSPDASRVLLRLVDNAKGIVLTNNVATLHNLRLVAAAAATASELDYYLAEPQLAGQRLVERAFVHLNRSLVVDAELRERWLVAFDRNEPSCEALGGVHLLAHGVWAFKVTAAGAATDLVLSERPLLGSGFDLGLAEFLVATEWKLIRDEKEVPSTAQAARVQVGSYGGGILAGIELRTARYIVLVSRRQIAQVPGDVPGAEGVMFKHVNVAIEAETPSKLGRRAGNAPAS